MLLKNDELIKEFYNIEKNKYPGVTLKQFKEICLSPWAFLKEQMGSGELPKVRFKYFGVFQVYEGRAKQMLDIIEEKFKSNDMDSKQYNKLKLMLKKYLNEA